MYTKDKRTKFINIDIQNRIRRTLYLKQYKNNSNKLSSSQNNIKIPGFENADKINNCSSFYVEDFEIKYFDLMYTTVAFICLTAAIFMIKSEMEILKMQVSIKHTK